MSQPWNDPAPQQGGDSAGAPDPWSRQASEPSTSSDSWGQQQGSASDAWSQQPASASDAWSQQPASASDAWSQQPAADEQWRSAPPPTYDSQPGYGSDASSAPYASTPPSSASSASWGQPAGSQQHAYGTDPHTGAQQPYATPYPYGTPAYGMPAQAGYGMPAGYGVVDDPRSKRGLTGLILSVSALVISFVLSWICARGYVQLLENHSLDQVESGSIPAGLEGAAVMMSLGLFGQILPTGLGIAGLIVSITAMKFPSQRTKAVIGLITAIVAPIASLIFWFVLMAPVIDKMS